MGYPGIYADGRLGQQTCQLVDGNHSTFNALVLLTPGGKKFPHNVAPGSGTVLHNGNPVAGYILRPSLMTACRYGMRWVSLNFAGFESIPLVDMSSISCLSFRRDSGFLIRWYRIPLSDTHDVSAPATMFVKAPMTTCQSVYFSGFWSFVASSLVSISGGPSLVPFCCACRSDIRFMVKSILRSTWPLTPSMKLTNLKVYGCREG